MKTPLLPARLAALVISSAAFFFSALPTSAAESKPAEHPTADKAAKLPVEHAFEKNTTGDDKGLYTLMLKNTSAKSLKLTLAVEESVVSHNRPKNRTVSVTVDAGSSVKNGAFAAHDKITISAEGFAPVTLTVP